MELQNLFFLLILITQASGASYNYDSNGDDWTDGVCSTGTSQSPINIVLSSATVDTSLGEFTLTNYDDASKYGNIKNNGHTIQVDMADDTVTLNGGGLDGGPFNLAQFHFHWGTSDSTGSEHTVDGKQSPLEIHFVHYKASLGDLGTAAGTAEGLAVLGFFFEVYPSDNANLDPFLDAVTSVANKDQTATLSSPPVINAIFQNVNTSLFVRYSGGLTTPGCNEVVQWTVFTEKIAISSAQLAKIRLSYQESSGTTLIGKNYRSTQDLNSRTVKISYDPDISAASILTQNMLFLLLPAIVGFLY
ncbi:carbonic anhydrase 1-like isoform X2 [Mytilus edulis]|uniref:carbonic anhydrase 1-like isoform X2 n=1 Tax=Mytilus edulis TaxID=6550 RepID=UPI0039F0DF58